MILDSVVASKLVTDLMPIAKIIIIQTKDTRNTDIIIVFNKTILLIRRNYLEDLNTFSSSK